MAGVDQHHIWQMIQRGFGTKRGRDHHIWVYKPNTPPKQTSTRLHGYIKHFNSLGDDNSADQILTDFENSIQSELQEIKQLADQTAISSDFMAPIVSHFEMRTAFLREEMSRIGGSVFSGLENVLNSKDRSAELLQTYIDTNPEMIDDQLDKLGYTGEFRELAKSYAITNIPKLIDQQSSELENLAQTLLAPASTQLENVVKTSHLKSISGGFNDIERTATHKKATYVVRQSSNPIILPDTGIAFLKKRGMTPISQKTDRLTDVIVPLSSNTYIHGSYSSQVLLETKTILKILASCSFDSFIAKENNPLLYKLTKRIGTEAKLVPDKGLEEATSFETLLKSVQTRNEKRHK